MNRLLYTLLCTAFLLGSCGHADQHNGHDDHDEAHGHHHDEKILITGYSDDCEVFAESAPLEAGKEAHILAHLSHIPGFRPYTQGTVTLTLTAGGKSVSQTLDAPQHPGIYEFEITPTAAGNAVAVFEISAPQGTTGVTVDGLRVFDNHHDAHEAAEEAEIHNSNAVAFPKEMSWKIDFATEQAAMRPMGQIVNTVGQVQPAQGDMRTLTAPSVGTVAFAAQLAEGSSVAAGQALFRIDGSNLSDNNLAVRVAEARNNFQAAEAEYHRAEDLAKDKLVTVSELTRARNAYENARTVYQSLAKGFNGGAATVTAPIAGTLTTLDVANGQFVQPGQALATVAQSRDLYIHTQVSPSQLAALAQVSNATLRRPNSPQVYSLADLSGSIVSQGRAVSGAGNMVPVVLRIANDGTFIPGTFVDVALMGADATPTTAVPRQALVEEMGNYALYVQLTPEYFEKRQVKTGRTDGQYTEIISGIAPGERVVSRGAVMLKLAQASGTLDAHSGHVH